MHYKTTRLSTDLLQEISKEALYSKTLYKLESFKTLETRYNGFGLLLYYKLKTIHPDILIN